jgi:hypothetical protein
VLDPAAPKLDQAVTLTASATTVPDGTTVTFLDGAATLGTGAMSSGTATLTLPAGLGAGQHELTASVPATPTTLAAVSPGVDLTIAKAATTIALTLSASRVGYGHRVTGSITVGDASGGTATVSYASRHRSVTIGADGSATFRLPATLPVGRHTVRATYDGTATAAASDQARAVLTVSKDPTRLRLAAATPSLPEGSSEVVAVHVIGHVRTRYPSGRITVTAVVAGKRTSKTVRLDRSDDGRVRLSIRLPRRSGVVRLRAAYHGDRVFAASKSAVHTVTAS